MGPRPALSELITLAENFPLQGTMHILFIVSCLCVATFGQLPSPVITNPTDWPGFSNIRVCAQNAIQYSLPYSAGCGNWTCACEHLSIAQATLLSFVITSCSSDVQDVSGAISILDGFCAQLPGVTNFQPLPTVTASTTYTLVGVTATLTSSTTITPSCNTLCVLC
jgi:hypothetical protein